MITRPKLPPKAGYVERVNARGEHYYVPTTETLAKQRTEAERLKYEDRIAELEEALELLLSGVTE